MKTVRPTPLSRWIFAAALLLFGSANAASKPNILLIYADDLGATSLGCTGSDLHQTPHLDQLASQGVKFSKAYAAAHVCSPSRAGLVTGKSPARLRLTDFLKGHPKPYAKLLIPDWQTGLKEDEVTLAKVLKGQGYVAAWLGKWHLGSDAISHGFDAGKQDWHHNRKEDQVDPKGVFTLNQEAMDFIDSRGEKPYFVAISHYATHGPIRGIREAEQRYQKSIDEHDPKHHRHAGFAAMLEALDQSVGALMKWLDEKGLAEKTMVIFTSDNGGEVGFTSNHPLRFGKGSLYEGGDSSANDRKVACSFASRCYQ